MDTGIDEPALLLERSPRARVRGRARAGVRECRRRGARPYQCDAKCWPTPEPLWEYAKRLDGRAHPTEMRGIIADRVDLYVRHQQVAGGPHGRESNRHLARLQGAASPLAHKAPQTLHSCRSGFSTSVARIFDS